MAEDAEAVIPSFYIRIKNTDQVDFIRLPYNISFAIDGMNARIATLRTHGGAWKVWVTKEGRGRRIYFRHGWRQFVQRNAVRVGVILTFNNSEKLDFKVQLFERDGTELQQQPCCTCALHTEPEEMPHQLRLESTTHLGGWGNKFRYPNTPFSRVALPRWVSDLPGFSERQCVSLVDGKGISWPVSITRESETDNKLKAFLGEGWHEFYNGHGLEVGDVVFFNILGHCSRDDTSTFEVKIRRFLWRNGSYVIVDS